MTRHRALLVEDDTTTAKALAELLEVIGHECAHVTNLEDAKAEVERGEFCYVLLDLSIKMKPHSIDSCTEAGEAVLEMVRAWYPLAIAAGKYAVPVIMLSGHSGEVRHVVSAIHAGADDFLAKPSSEPLKPKLREILRERGRENHEACAAITKRARRVANTIARVAVTAKRSGARYEVVIDDTPILLTEASFVVFLKLAIRRIQKPGVWIYKNDLGAKDDYSWSGMSRLQRDIRRQLPSAGGLIENDGDQHYRLIADITVVADVEQLRAIRKVDDEILREIPDLPR